MTLDPSTAIMALHYLRIALVGQKEAAFLDLIQGVTSVEKPSFAWLTNNFDPDDPALGPIFLDLGGSRQGLAGKRGSRLRPDAYLPALHCLLEFDEAQHFTPERKRTLFSYPPDHKLGFDRTAYLGLCDSHGNKATSKGAAGYRRPTTEFPFAGGRHAQRAMFDVLRDVLPIRYGLAPTIRVSEFELQQSGSANIRDRFERMLRNA